MPNDTDIEQIAPTPWRRSYHENALVIADAGGKDVVCCACAKRGWPILDHIIRCVNRRAELRRRVEQKLSADIGFAEAAAVVKRIEQEKNDEAGT